MVPYDGAHTRRLGLVPRRRVPVLADPGHTPLSVTSAQVCEGDSADRPRHRGGNGLWEGRHQAAARQHGRRGGPPHPGDPAARSRPPGTAGRPSLQNVPGL